MQIQIKSKQFQLEGVMYSEDILPDGFTIVDTYTPTYSTTPWDYYGMCHQRELSRVLRNNNIEFVLLQTVKTRINPVGSGPKGRVRFGDDMMPGEYRIAVPHEKVIEAQLAFQKHKQAIQNWLNNKGPMPKECGG